MIKGRWQWWIAGALLVAFIWRFQSLTLYFLAAVALSFIGKPVATWVAQKRVAKRPLGHSLGAASALMLMASISTGVVMLFAPLVQEQIAALSRLDATQLTQHWNQALALVDDWTTGVDLSGEGMANSADLAEQALELIRLDDAGLVFSGILSSIGNVFVTTFSVVFMALTFDFAINAWAEKRRRVLGLA